jgi:hypothetical protein
MISTKRRALALAIPLALLVAACGSDDSSSDDASGDTTAETAAGDDAATDDTTADTTADTSDTTGDTAGDGDEMSDEAVCPTNLVIQTDWWPEIEHGGTYQLIGPGGEADASLFTYSGPIQEQYAVGGIETVEVRSGGDAIEFQPVQTVMATDSDITLGYVNTDDAIYSSPTVEVTGVATTLEVNPQVLYWDPEQTEIDPSDPNSFGTSGKRILHFPSVTYMEWMIAKGFIDESQSDPNYGGSSDEFRTNGGNFIQQGFATNEIYKYENEVPWKDGAPAPIDFALIHDLGWQPYPAMYTVLSDDLEELSPCLEVLVPVLQQAWVDYLDDPSAMAAALLDITGTYNNYWTLSEPHNDAGFVKMAELGIDSNGPDETYGNFDAERVQGLFDELVPIMEANGISLPDGFTAESAYTNEFIDVSIGR